ncbi:hypothetical protein [Sediminicoccus sp. KRV36]|uniref:hypothetical protein n=1 Tax=Sediminicoccus sp. KRV36 TaxID=3133721 RepID=UPI00200FE54C|nr:hypothetical protein [Sediminicoccus rosea]UPY36232.1 hypothetical protein LHU95_18735 [Sediminicoccus rosea]
MTICAPRRALPGLLATLALAACAGGPPAPPPAADAVAPPAAMYTLSPGTPVDGDLRLVLQRGQAVARGTLATNGQNLPVTVTGLSAQGGAARVSLRGQVYGLPRGGPNFPGTYNIITDNTGGMSELTGGLRLGNENLVLIVMQPPREGMVLSVAPGGMVAALGR